MIVMIAVTVMLIGMAAGLPSVYQEAQREKEEELIFRGNEYARAIYLYNQRFQHYPASVKDLLHSNNLSFLRHAYKDPMTPDGKWRFIHSNAQGAVLDSLTLTTATTLGIQQGGGFGQPSPGQSGLPGTQIPNIGGPQQFGTQGGSFGSSFGQSSGQSNFGSQSSFGTSFGNSVPNGGSSSDELGLSSPLGQPGQTESNDETTENGTADQTGKKKKKKKKAPGCGEQSESRETGPTSSFFSNANGPQGVFIVGVASCSDKDSIRIWNKHDNYSEWEFLAVSYTPANIGGSPSVNPQNGQGQGGTGLGSQPGQPGFGQPGQPGFGPGQPGEPPLTDQPPQPSEPDPDPGEPPRG